MKHKRHTRESERERWGGGGREGEYMFVQVCVCTCALELYSNLATYSYNAHCVKFTYIWTRMCWMLHHIMQLALFYAITTLTHILMTI
jgi:hypothetical protein